MNRHRSARLPRVPWLVLTAVVLAPLRAAGAQDAEAITYTLRFPAPHTHYVEVEASIPTGARTAIELMLPVWTPGSYMVREYARHVEDLVARTLDGSPLAVEKSRKNRWTIATGGAGRIRVSYRVYSREMSVRTNWVEHDFAMLNGAPTFLTLADDDRARPHEVRLELPPHWRGTMTSLPEAIDRGPHVYRAESYDALVDSPIVAGNPSAYAFRVDGTPHLLVNIGEGGAWDGPRAAADVAEIVAEHRRMWGGLPYDRYVFLNMITEARGGLEHGNSALIMTSRWQMRGRARYVSWLSAISHELFHAWNIKRLRPAELGPFDYENEVHTRSLWIAEGLTEYYADLALRRAGLITDNELLAAVSRDIEQLQSTPGRLVQPVEQASYDAWIKYYRPDENSSNTAISYYTKGAVIGFLLDARIRHATMGVRSLDDVMRLAYARFSGERGYTPREFRSAAADVAGIDLDPWFARALESIEELDYAEAVRWFGLSLPAVTAAGDSDGDDELWLGLSVRDAGGRLVVSQVQRDSPAYDAGFNVDDEILAIGEYRVGPSQWTDRLDEHVPGDRLSVLIARRDELRRLDVTLGARPDLAWRLSVDPNATPEQKARLKAWMEGG